jgi:hypothetical protein
MRRIGMIWAALVVMGCGGIQEGSEATIRHHPQTFPMEGGATRVVDATLAYNHRAHRGSTLIDGGTPVRVLKVEGDMAQVAVLAGEHSGLALWVAKDDLERK